MEVDIDFSFFQKHNLKKMAALKMRGQSTSKQSYVLLPGSAPTRGCHDSFLALHLPRSEAKIHNIEM